MSDSRRGFGLDIGFSDHLQIVTTRNYNSLTELHTPNITVNYGTYKVSSSHSEFQLTNSQAGGHFTPAS
jgi:hypothetical protein